MIRRSLILLAVALVSTACGSEEVTLGDHWMCNYSSQAGTWQHDIHRYSDGSTFSSCEVAGGWFTVSSVSLYRADQPGSALGYCSLVHDWDSSPTAGWWKFEFNGSTSTAKYGDPGSATNGSVVTMNCTKN